MGNCVCVGYGSSADQADKMVRVVTSTGGIMELYPPITADYITNEFPGHRIFRSRDLFSQPLLNSEQLHVGELYYLLPATTTTPAPAAEDTKSSTDDTNSTDNNNSLTTTTPPYRMSFENQRLFSFKRSDPDVYPRYHGSGVWKVRLVINPEQLSEILSQDSRTEELIESVRTVAKCATGGPPSTVANSDQCSVTSNSWQ
ncbi:hypothetical protein Ancab_036729 [Ancistrocladus abbreviatus]